MTPASPARTDTRMMAIAHSALRRDLARAADALSRQPAPGDAQRVAIAGHLQAMMAFLLVHHHGEDAWLWPTVRRLNPTASDVIDAMEADHEAIAPKMTSVTAAASAYAESAAGRESLAGALLDLRGTLEPHLRREEDEAMPIVASTLTQAQWDAWEQEYYIKPKSNKDLGLEGHWLIDGGNREVYDRRRRQGQSRPEVRAAARLRPDVPLGVRYPLGRRCPDRAEPGCGARHRTDHRDTATPDPPSNTLSTSSTPHGKSASSASGISRDRYRGVQSCCTTTRSPMTLLAWSRT